MIPIATLIAAPSRNERAIPIAPINTKPVSTAPTTAPAVLTAYSALTRAPNLDPRTTDEALSTGSVNPMRKVGTSKTRNPVASLATVSTGSEPVPS